MELKGIVRRIDHFLHFHAQQYFFSILEHKDSHIKRA